MPNAKDLVLRLRSITDQFKTDAPVRELDDLEHSLKATGDQSTRSAREVRAAADDLNAPGFDKAAAESETTARRMRAAAEDMAGGVAKGARDIDTQTGNITQSMGEAGSEAGQEFIGNIAEGIGSGSASVTDVVQGTLGGLTNLAATLTGPVGLAAGAAAAGIGLVFSKVKAEADKADERVQTLIGALHDLGETGSAEAQKIIWSTWLEDMSAMPDELHQINKLTQMAGVSGEEFKKAITGSAEAQDDVKQKMKETGDAIQKNYEKTGTLTEAEAEYLQHWRDIVDEVDDQNTALDETKQYHKDINELSGEAKGKTKTWTDEIKNARDEAKGLAGDLDKATRDRSMNVYAYVRTQGDKSLLPDPRNAGAKSGYTGGYR